MARTPLLPGADIQNWARQITQRIERDYAALQRAIDDMSASAAADLHSVSAIITTAFEAADRSVSACITGDLRSMSTVLKADLASVSSVLQANINAVSNTISVIVAAGLVTAADLRSLSADIKTDIGSVSAAIKTDISSVSAVLQANINAVSNTISVILAGGGFATGADLRSLSIVIKTDISSVSAVLQAAINSLSNTISVILGGGGFATVAALNAVSNTVSAMDVRLNSLSVFVHGSLSSFETFRDSLSSAEVKVHGSLSVAEAYVRGSLSSAEAFVRGSLSVAEAFVRGSLSTAENFVRGSLSAFETFRSSLSTAENFVRGSLSSAEVYLRGSISNTISVIAANLNAVSNTLSLLFASIINPRSPTYGAVGDGTTDDTAALRAALIAAKDKILFIPSGTYKLYGALTLTSGSVNLLGTGAQSTQLTWAATATSVGIVLLGTTSTDFHYVHDLCFSTAKDGGVALTLDYSAEMVTVTGGIVMTLDRVSPRFVVERCVITGVGSGADPTVVNWYQGVAAIAAVNGTCRDVNIICRGTLAGGGGAYRAYDANRYAINFVGNPSSGNVQNGHPVVIYVHNCNITYPYCGVQAVDVEGVFVTDNNIIFGDYGLIVTSEADYHHPQIKCTGNHINMQVNGALVDGQYNSTFADNLFYAAQGSVTNAVGINMISANFSVIKGNQFQSWSYMQGALGYIGVNLLNSSYAAISDNIFYGTVTASPAFYIGVAFQTGSANNTGNNNVFFGVGTPIYDGGTGNTLNRVAKGGVKQASISVFGGQLVTISFTVAFQTVARNVVANPMNFGSVGGDDWLTINSYSAGGFIARYNTVTVTGTRSIQWMAFGY